jgi:hypothetical protein
VSNLAGRRWLRAPEEEHGGARVYRPEGHPLPLARGREGLTFHADGRVDYRAPGPVDAPVTEVGTWHGTGDPGDTVRLDLAGQVIPLRITEVGDDVLRLEWPRA